MSACYPWLADVEAEFSERLANDRLAHAFLVSGPVDCGKVDLARRFAAAALCEQGRYPACGSCRSCQLDASGAHPDRHIVTFEPNPKKPEELRKELVVDQVRALTASLCLTNTISHRKAAIIHPVEAMNKSAANALLKTLEEPPGDAVILLVSHAPSRLLATIRSRCQKLTVRLPETSMAIDWLKASANDCTDELAEMALEAAAGSPLRALRLLKEGEVAQYADVNARLDALKTQGGHQPGILEELSEADPERLWSWLSLRSAREARLAVQNGHDARKAVDLQSQADRNRVLASTPVRKDLLLRDWLIQWCGIDR